MPELVEPLVDAEALVVAHLRADFDVEEHFGAKVSTALPPSKANPYCQLWRLPGQMLTAETQWLERARLTFAVWADTKESAWDGAAIVCRALGGLPDEPHPLGVVTAFELEVTPYYSEDPETDEPRYLFTAALTVHPLT